ncbi:MAG: hypothetical protein JW727_04765 [Candidatus Aenigmarchaeota archaeon]|nr:hypothetical protein [Candidatus Aenigmarchaeota archaeon]
MWENLVGILVALLLTLAFYVLGKVFFSEGYKGHPKHGHQQAWGLVIFAIGAIALTALILVHFFGFWVILKKFVGFVLFAFGFFMLTKFPTSSDWQPEGFFWLGFFLGLFSTFFGIYWLLF